VSTTKRICCWIPHLQEFLIFRPHSERHNLDLRRDYRVGNSLNHVESCTDEPCPYARSVDRIAHNFQRGFRRLLIRAMEGHPERAG
jgi:hypothetical protein